MLRDAAAFITIRPSCPKFEIAGCWLAGCRQMAPIFGEFGANRNLGKPLIIDAGLQPVHRLCAVHKSGPGADLPVFALQ
jgi:hypothetical protein